MEIVLAVVAILAVAATLVVLAVKRLIYICQPNEVLVFSGSRRRMGGRWVGYRLIQGGRGIRIPMLERVDRLDLTNMVIDIRVSGAYSKGGIPLNVEGMANVKIASEEPTIGNAIERFLGKSRVELIRVAKETLEGNLRGVLATLTPEEVNHDRVKFAQSLLTEADQDLKRLGLVLDTLKIQNVSDDKGYLDSLGRKQSADLQMRSRIAEAENAALAAERDAKNFEDREIARLEAGFAMAKAEAERRIADAQTKKGAMVAEQKAEVMAEVARSKAELQVQAARIEQVKLQLEADRIRPAEARKAEMISAARGEASRILEDGKATARSLEEIGRTWAEAGDAARQVFVAQKMNKLVEKMMATVHHVPVDHVTVLDARLAEGGNNLAVKATVAAEQLKQALGIDVPALLQRLSGAGSSNGETTALPPLPARELTHK
ncbi:MAG: flotillin family protein [Myxococcota bacterium]